MKTYKFFDLSGQYLETIITDDPAGHFGEIAAFNNVPNDEIVFEEVGEQFQLLKNYLTQIAAAEERSELDLINDMLGLAARHNHDQAVEALLIIRQPLIQNELNKAEKKD